MTKKLQNFILGINNVDPGPYAEMKLDVILYIGRSFLKSPSNFISAYGPRSPNLCPDRKNLAVIQVFQLTRVVRVCWACLISFFILSTVDFQTSTADLIEGSKMD